ncbi:MAG: tryptophan-rich sensory protein [Candidatus Pacearchaeota archaeon]|nr:tryptophan-rich sensory protein [Candidatus Pacearchaeota archaeon]
MKNKSYHKRIKWGTLVLSFLIVIVVALLGSLFTGANTKSEWYIQNKPSITPPNYVFPIVWNILFILIALALYFTWTKAEKNQKNKVALTLFSMFSGACFSSR